MALVIYLKGEGNQALVVKGTMEELEKQMNRVREGETKDITFAGWHGKKIKIFKPRDNISHIIEESDAQMKKNMEENKRRTEEMAQAQGRKVIQTPGLMIPGRGNN